PSYPAEKSSPPLPSSCAEWGNPPLIVPRKAEKSSSCHPAQSGAQSQDPSPSGFCDCAQNDGYLHSTAHEMVDTFMRLVREMMGTFPFSCHMLPCPAGPCLRRNPPHRYPCAKQR